MKQAIFKIFTIFAICTICTFSSACARHRIQSGYSLNAWIDPAEIKGKIHLTKCEPGSQRLQCKLATFTCKQPGCGQLEVEHATQTAPATTR